MVGWWWGLVVRKLIGISPINDFWDYGWWKKSWTTFRIPWMDTTLWFIGSNGITITLSGAAFCPSTVWFVTLENDPPRSWIVETETHWFCRGKTMVLGGIGTMCGGFVHKKHVRNQSHWWYGSEYWFGPGLAAWFRAKSTNLRKCRYTLFCEFYLPSLPSL